MGRDWRDVYEDQRRATRRRHGSEKDDNACGREPDMKGERGEQGRASAWGHSSTSTRTHTRC